MSNYFGYFLNTIIYQPQISLCMYTNIYIVGEGLGEGLVKALVYAFLRGVKTMKALSVYKYFFKKKGTKNRVNTLLHTLSHKLRLTYMTIGVKSTKSSPLEEKHTPKPTFSLHKVYTSRRKAYTLDIYKNIYYQIRKLGLQKDGEKTTHMDSGGFDIFLSILSSPSFPSGSASPFIQVI